MAVSTFHNSARDPNPTFSISVAVLLFCAISTGCGPKAVSPPTEPVVAETVVPPVPPTKTDSRPPPMARPVPLYVNGALKRMTDAARASDDHLVLVDLGEAWTPYIFTERARPDEAVRSNPYRSTYLALARGEFPSDIHGDRAREDKYLELYGIPPTLGLLRRRLQHAKTLSCAVTLDLSPLLEFEGQSGWRSADVARRDAEKFTALEAQLARVAAQASVASIAALDPSSLSSENSEKLTQYQRLAPRVLAVRAAQDRLACEGYFGRRARYTRGALDGPTREAIVDFERRHRVFGWGQLTRDTVAALRLSPMESERESVIRIMTERAVHAAGVIEDGSVARRNDGVYLGRDMKQHEVPNLTAAMREAVITAFGLQTTDSTLAFLESLGELAPDGEHTVAFESPPLPDYYSADMNFEVEIDRGDVWYDFPYDDAGNEVAQPVSARPRVTVFVRWGSQRIAIVTLGTTIGGWRSEYIDLLEWWKYKNSPAGPRVWTDIVAAPVWIPPESTPPRELLKRKRNTYEVNYHEMGPSYASAYGLVAAYHRQFVGGNGTPLRIIGDEGIRTHGSVDYMSIMRRHSHGCHRLHNHIAVRLMSFILAHRAHVREGEQRINVLRDLEHDGQTVEMKLQHGGYVFALERPVPVEVLEGRIRGNAQDPLEIAIPKFNRDFGAYVMPDGSQVVVRGDQLIPSPHPVLIVDGGLPGGPDGGVYNSIPAPTGLTIHGLRIEPTTPSNTLNPSVIAPSLAPPTQPVSPTTP